MHRLSLAAARRVALAAQGFADARPTGAVDRRHLKRVVGRTGLLQVDSVNVFERAHHLPLFSRLGPYDRDLLHRSAYVHRDLFEYWGHEASLLPVSSHPLLRWRMDRAAGLEEGWGRTAQVARERPDVVAAVLRRIEDDGPATAGELHAALDGGARSAGPWWDWSLAKVAVEHLFWAGRVTTATRQGFERVYDLTERVLPAAVLALPVPARVDAQRELVRLAARAHGVATLRDLRDYYRMRVDETAVAVTALVEEGELLPVEVEGWQQPAYLSREARVPRRVPASALLSPFDPLVWERSRASRMFGFDYRIEIYVPAARRVHGYYVLPFLHDEALRARVDLKSDRQAGVLRVQASWLEPGSDAASTAQALAGELRLAARWQGLPDVVVEPRGDLAPVLAATVAAAG
jgi:uncharacterized protein YcaQ